MPTSGQAVLHSLADAAGLDIDLDLSAVHEDAFTAAFSELGIPAAVVSELPIVLFNHLGAGCRPVRGRRRNARSIIAAQRFVSMVKPKFSHLYLCRPE